MFHLFSVNMNIGHITVSFSYDGKISFHPVLAFSVPWLPWKGTIYYKHLSIQ